MAKPSPWTVKVASLGDTHFSLHAYRPTNGGGTEERRWCAFPAVRRAEEIGAKVAAALKAKAARGEECTVVDVDSAVLIALDP
jgi:hypothetical protein